MNYWQYCLVPNCTNKLGTPIGLTNLVKGANGSVKRGWIYKSKIKSITHHPALISMDGFF